MNQTPATGQAHALECAPDSDQYPLIGPGDPPPYMTYNETGSARVLLVADHACPYFPAAMNQLGVADWVLERHVTWDIGSDMLTRCLAGLIDAPAILAGFSRLIVDPNRNLDDPTAFVEVSDGIAIPGNLSLTGTQKELRAKSFFHPYHDAIAARLSEFLAAGTVPALISIHTCTPVFAQVVRRWHVGVMWDKDARIALPLIENLRQTDGICCGDNEPYSGRHVHDYTIDHHAEPLGLPHVGVEVRQDLVGTTEGAHKWAAILAAALQDTLADNDLYRPLEA